jgi:uncharacterized delta-60 repeat protein
LKKHVKLNFMKHNFNLNFKILKGLLSLLIIFVSFSSNAQCWQSPSNKGGCVMSIKTNGTLWGWGGNAYGQLGDGTLVNKNVPTQIGSGTNWSSVAAGLNHTIAVKTDGTLWAWGQNFFGQLGDGTNIDKTSPVQIGSATNWKSVSAGFNHSFAIKTDGTVWTWGSNGNNQIGDGTTVDRNTPTQVGTATNWKAISAGGWFNLAQKTDGTLWAWGSNIYGQLGDGTTVNKSTPVQIGTATNWDIISGGGWHSFAKKTDGTIWGWGSNNYGHLGDGTYVAKNTPTQLGSATNWQFISAGSDDTFGIKTDGTLWAWGRNQSGQFGNGTIINQNHTPVQTGIGNTWQSVLSGQSLTIATTCDGSLVSAGSNPYGQLGNGTTNVNSSTFVSTSSCSMVIDAANDDFYSTPISSISGGTTSSVAANDTVNGVALNNSCISISLVNNGGLTGAAMSSTGIITVPSATTVGNYTLTYQICQNSIPGNCDQATVLITVYEPGGITPDLIYSTRANSLVEIIDTQSTGKILLSGQFTTYNNISAIALLRLNPNLTLDTTFPAIGPIAADDMKIQSDDKIVLVGSFTGFNGGSNGKGLIRLNADGTVDPNFNVGGSGFGTKNLAKACAIQSDGKILIGGTYINSYNGVPCKNMIRLNTDGTIDPTFNSFYYSGTVGPIFNIVVQPDGKILVSGNKGTIAGSQPNLYRLNSDGSLDTSFALGDVGTNIYTTICTSCASGIQSIVLQPDGKILVVGAFNAYNGTPVNNIIRLTSTGILDSTFNGLGTATNRVIKDLALDTTTGKMFIAGEFTTFNGAAVNKIIRLTSTGGFDGTFNSGTGTAHTNTSSFIYNSIHTLKRQNADGKVLLGGFFTSYNGISATNITRIQPTVAGGQAKGAIEYYESEPEIDINAIAGNITVYPNPSNGIFNINLSDDTENYTNIEVFNLLGVLVYKDKLNAKSLNEINLSQVGNGYYFARIFNENNSKQFKLIKK